MRALAAVAAVAALTLALGSMPAEAGSVTVGSPDNGNCYPFECNDSGASIGVSIDYFEIYNSTAFSGPIDFNSITFQQWPSGPGTVLNGDYTISFSTTTTPLGSVSYPVAPLSNTASFFSGALGGQTGDVTITGTPYAYNPVDGNLVMEVIASNQANVPNGSGNGYNLADYTGTNVLRAYDIIPTSDTASGTGALVTTFNSAVPEPTTWAMLLLGVAIIGGGLRMARRKDGMALTAV